MRRTLEHGDEVCVCGPAALLEREPMAEFSETGTIMALGPFRVAEKLRDAKKMHGFAIFMRHGETPWNREGRVMGRQPVELDEIGRAQIESAVPLARSLELSLVVSSPLVRARQSAEI